MRLSEVDKLEYVQNKGMSITVYFEQRKGSAFCSDLQPDAVLAALQKACSFAKYASQDSYAGIPASRLLASEIPDCDLYHPWAITPEQAIEIARRCEALGLDMDPCLHNSEGASVDTYTHYGIVANSHGFLQGYPSTRHGLSCVLLGQKREGEMERDYAYTVARHAEDLLPEDLIAKEVAEKVLARLGARQVNTGQYPVLFRADVAKSLFKHLFSAISGSSLYRKASFLLDSVGKPILSKQFRILEHPHLKRGLGSQPFDAEGVKNTEKAIVEQGILQTYLLSSYSARKLALAATGHAGGVTNIQVLSEQTFSFDELLQSMGTGLLVTDVMGHGVNLVTGDYSRGASGFWVSNGKIQFPVSEITIAGNLRDMLSGIVALGNDTDKRSALHTGSVLIDKMTVAGR